MNSLSQDIRHVIASRVQSASPAEILAIASTLCAEDVVTVSELQPTRGTSCRFVSSDQVTEDLRTGLTWSRGNVIGDRMNWADAKKAVAKLSLGGFTDWRLPTIRELLTLVDYEKSSPSIDTTAFECESAAYWTSTPYAPSPGGCAWVVDFGSGVSFWGFQSSECFVRAVRAGQLIGNWGW